MVFLTSPAKKKGKNTSVSSDDVLVAILRALHSLRMYVFKVMHELNSMKSEVTRFAAVEAHFKSLDDVVSKTESIKLSVDELIKSSKEADQATTALSRRLTRTHPVPLRPFLLRPRLLTLLLKKVDSAREKVRQVFSAIFQSRT